MRRNGRWPFIIWIYHEGRPTWNSVTDVWQKSQYRRQAIRQQQGGVFHLCGGEVFGQLQIQPAADTETLQNKFMVEGLDGIKYTYHNGYIAKGPKQAVMNFINALERIPGMIEKREKENAELLKDIPVLQEIVAATWAKDGEIKRLGEELAALNRKIQLTLKPIGQHENGEGKETEVEDRDLPMAVT